MTGSELDRQLVSAVLSGDTDAVRDLLHEGADPNTPDPERGLPVLCAAVAAYDETVAEALMDGGADPDRELPDGSTPLWRALDSGSPAVFESVLGKDPLLRLPELEREQLLARARSWYETGPVEGLRRRTGVRGPAVSVQVTDGDYDWVDQYALDGLVVRAGHGAILTSLEWSFRIPTPVGELIDRAVRIPDEEHVDWSAVWLTLTRLIGRQLPGRSQEGEDVGLVGRAVRDDPAHDRHTASPH
jgi:hypothetical protein